MRAIQKDAAVIVIDGEGKFHNGVIIEELSTGSARIDLTPRNDKGEAVDPKTAPLGHTTTQATYSEHGEPGTFHYPDQAKDVKQAIASAANADETTQPVAAASAKTSSSK